MRNFAVALLLAVGLAGVAAAAVREDVPEIDPGSVTTASALVGSALLMLRRRAKR